jgi:arabinofuranan 3-O-arabinosyltransferase
MTSLTSGRPGQLLLKGTPAGAYCWPTHKAMEVAALGRPFDGYFGWQYPPPFLFIAVALALVPYTAAFVLWTFGTPPAYAAAWAKGLPQCRAFRLRSIVAGTPAGTGGRPVRAAHRQAAPRPAGPIALIAGGNWRAFITAGIVAMLMAAASWAAFGTVTWQAFVDSIGHTSQAFLSKGWADRYKLQTAFGLTRTLGGPEWLSWTVQAMVAIVAAVCVAEVWRSRTAYEVKASALVTAALLATPYLYLYTYDLVVLAVPLAFLFRLARTDGFLPNELTGVGAACALVLIFPFVNAPVGLGAILVVAALIARRALVFPAK